MILWVFVTAFATYTATTLLGYVIHWALHQRWSGPLRKSHMAHHLVHYPPRDLVSDSYRSAGKDSAVYTFLLAFSPLLLLPIVLWLVGWVSLPVAVAAFFSMALVGLMNDIIHDSFHVRDHWLSRVYPGYESLRIGHFVHHRNMKRNFGIYSFAWDRVFRTFRR